MAEQKDKIVYFTVGVRQSELDNLRDDRRDSALDDEVELLEELNNAEILEAGCPFQVVYVNELYSSEEDVDGELLNREDIKITLIKHELIRRAHDCQHKSVRDEIALDEFCFITYWAECEGNKGERLTLEEVWAEFVKDIANED